MHKIQEKEGRGKIGFVHGSVDDPGWKFVIVFYISTTRGKEGARRGKEGQGYKPKGGDSCFAVHQPDYRATRA